MEIKWWTSDDCHHSFIRIKLVNVHCMIVLSKIMKANRCQSVLWLSHLPFLFFRQIFIMLYWHHCLTPTDLIIKSTKKTERSVCLFKWAATVSRKHHEHQQHQQALCPEDRVVLSRHWKRFGTLGHSACTSYQPMLPTRTSVTVGSTKLRSGIWWSSCARYGSS